MPEPDNDYVAVCDRYLPLVQHAVTSYAFRLPGYVDLDDLAGAAILGLVEAARRYDPDRGVPFEPWALQRIRGAILDAARSADFASRRTRSQARTLERTTDTLTQKLGRPPTDKELRDELGLDPRDLHDLRARVHQGVVISLDAVTTTTEDEALSYAEVLVDADMPPLETLERRELDTYVRDCVQSLPERLQWIIDQYFYQGRTSSELAQELGVTESRISQLRSEAIRVLREALGVHYEEISARTSKPASPLGQKVAESAAARATYAQRLSAAGTQTLL